MSNGFLIVEANGGLNQQRLSVCKFVTSNILFFPVNLFEVAKLRISTRWVFVDGWQNLGAEENSLCPSVKFLLIYNCS